MPTKLCLHTDPPCGNAATYRGRCAQHSRQRERQTHSNRSIYNSKRWKLLRRHVLFDAPLCTVCGDIARDVDHILAIEDGGDPWSITNLQPLCAHHHAAKTAREVRAR